MVNTFPFGEQLLSWRRAKGLTQEKLSALANIPRPNISCLECGQSDPSLSTVRRLAAALGISLGQLLEEKPIAKPLDRHTLDALAREAVGRLGLPEEPRALRDLRARVKRNPRLAKQVRQLHRILAHREAAVTHSAVPAGVGSRLSRYLKAQWGEAQWKILERRLDKHSAL